MHFAKWTYRIAGIYGLIALVPLYFLEDFYGRQNPPAINHPEFYYGFLGVGLAWQIFFLIISKDPRRFRPAMVPTVIEKLSFCIPVPILCALHRTPVSMLGSASVDAIFAILFVMAYVRTPSVEST